MSFGRQLGDLARGGVRFVNIVSDLRNIPPTKYGTLPIQPIQTLGGATIGDGKGALWYWDDASVAADDGANVVLPAGHSGAGRYRRLTGVLPLSGGTMTGPLRLAAAPVAANEAATKIYVDNLTGNKLTQAQVDARVYGIGDPRYVKKTGDIMTGPLYHRHSSWALVADTAAANANATGRTAWHVALNNQVWAAGTNVLQYVEHYHGVRVDWVFTLGGVAFYLRHDGRMYAPHGFVTYSDERVKDNIQVIPDAITKIEQIRGCTFDRKDTISDIDGTAVPTAEAGVIAQDVQAVLPEAVFEVNSTAGKLSDTPGPTDYSFPAHTLGVDTNAVVALLVQAVKELSAKVKALEAKVP